MLKFAVSGAAMRLKNIETMSESDYQQGLISIVIPAKDEQDNLAQLVGELVDVMVKLGRPYELILVDDGSTDATWQTMISLAGQLQPVLRAYRLRRNFGKAVALDCGFGQARGAIVFTMDADLQDDPREIPAFLDRLDEGYDLVSGWKQNRQDPLSKNLPSRFFNWVTCKLTGIELHDFNCGFKAYRREVLDSVRLYGELHRYIPVLAYDAGFRVGELPVHHRPRIHGQSKYGWERLPRGFLDLITVLATTRYLQKPGHLFGGLGVLAGIFGTAILLYLSVLWLLGLGPIGTRPLFFLGVLLQILSIQLVSLGVLAELITRHAAEPPVSRLINASTESAASPQVEGQVTAPGDR